MPLLFLLSPRDGRWQYQLSASVIHVRFSNKGERTTQRFTGREWESSGRCTFGWICQLIHESCSPAGLPSRWSRSDASVIETDDQIHQHRQWVPLMEGREAEWQANNSSQMHKPVTLLPSKLQPKVCCFSLSVQWCQIWRVAEIKSVNLEWKDYI